MKAGEVFSIADENMWVDGCTISGSLMKGDGYYVSVFSMAPDTNISEELYLNPMCWLVVRGNAEAFVKGKETYPLREGELFFIPREQPVGIRTDTGCIYTEIIFRRETRMKDIVKTGEIFQLKDLIPYEDGKIVNMDLLDDEKAKFVIMAFDEGQELPEHAAPGDAIVFGLEGEGIIGYGGNEYTIHAGENFRFEKGGKHYVKANGRYKMALVLIRE